MTYLVKLSLTLTPVWHQDPPVIRVGINQDLQKFELRQSQNFEFQFQADADCELIVEFLNKKDTDTVQEHNLDKAVIIEKIKFFDIEDPRFVWAGVYEPKYPEPWASQQRQQGVVLNPRLSPHCYLSWNGKWTLTFSVPVFTWIHKIQDLGWIYS